MADLTHEHLQALHLFDWALTEGPDYKKLAVQGALAGAVLSLLVGRPWEKGKLGHALVYGASGAAAATLGATALFAVGRAVSDRSHEALAAAATAGEFSP
jgi:hypothetical protein